MKTSAALLIAAVSISGAKARAPSESKQEAANSGARFETHRDLIQKAQNLTLQRDRLQTSQLLVRGLKREPKGSTAYKELAKTLNDLTTVFYTEKAQTAFVAGDSILDTKPRDSIEHFQAALRIEDGNVAILKSLARAHLILGECTKAQKPIAAAVDLNPASPEVQLLELQLLECLKSYDALSAKLQSSIADLGPIEQFYRGILMRDHVRKDDLKKARALMTTWEKASSEYPEVHYWRWQLSQLSGASDRSAAVRYVQACQNLTPRKRKSYILDVDLCKGREAAETYLKDTGLRTTGPKDDMDDDAGSGSGSGVGNE